IAAGAFRGETGNGANQLCLPSDPVYSERGWCWSKPFVSLCNRYQIDNFPTLSDRSWHDVPCAVCKAPTRFAKLMIPGKNLCPSNEWTLEYRGYLMAERAHSVHQRSMYICVDQEMQIDRIGQRWCTTCFVRSRGGQMRIQWWRASVWSLCRWLRTHMCCLHPVTFRNAYA
ncbi:putative short-chain collagen C4, partial [Apostichopus japonicus]